LPNITQGYISIKLQNFLGQNDFTNKPTISANQTFIYNIIDFKIANKAQKDWIFQKIEKITLSSLEYSIS
jgi:hypothetical protein